MDDEGRRGDPCELTQYVGADVDIDELLAQLAVDSDNTYLLDLLAFAYYCEEQNDEAVMTYQRLVALEFERASHHLYLGNALFKLGRRTEAFREWTLADKLDPEGKHGGKARQRLALVTGAAKVPQTGS